MSISMGANTLTTEQHIRELGVNEVINDKAPPCMPLKTRSHASWRPRPPANRRRRDWVMQGPSEVS